MSKSFGRFVSFWLILSVIVTACSPLTAFATAAEPLNIMDYGAVGDGLTDDRAAIQAAIDAAASGEGGGVVVFPAGTYRVEEIVFLRSNITLMLDDDATIVNCINRSGACIIFMTGYYAPGSSKVNWEDTENITIIGGTIDMNGELNDTADAAKNLPNIGASGSSGALALGYCDNVLIEGVTFLNSYKGHVMQICACDGVIVRNCSFKGQAHPSGLTDSGRANLEMIQIEPSSTKGFPYAANETGEPSQNITVENCYFGASDTCGEPSVAVGTHSQLTYGDNCNHITITNNVFDNMMYAGVRFCGYEDVTIRGNTFTKKTEAESVNYRTGGCVLINAYCYNNTTDQMQMNRNITIDNNILTIADPLTRGIRVAKDQETYLGTVTDITITNNTVVNTSTGSTLMGIQAMRISDGLTIIGNTIRGGYRGIEVQYCTGNITMNTNHISGLEYQYVRFISCGDNQKIFCYTHGSGTFDISTANNAYSVTAVPNSGQSFTAYYKQNALEDVMSTSSTLVLAIDTTTSITRHALFEGWCSHSYTTVVTAPSCTGYGYTVYTCSACGDSYADTYTDARGHSFSNYVSDGNASCTEDGTMSAVCDHGCGTRSTILNDGSARGHSFGNWITEQPASCTGTGTQIRTCGDCGDVQTRSVGAVGHDYDVTAHNATCKTYAIFDFICNACGDSFTRGADEMTSQWIDTLPTGMDASEFVTKIQYRWSDLETVSSDQASMVGGTLKSTTWVQSDAGTVYYVPDWPSGFSTGSSLYTAYNKASSKKTASETAAGMTTVASDAVVGYLYYHWCNSNSRYSTSTESGIYTNFHAYYSTTAPGNYKCDTSDDSYQTADNCCGNSEWFFVTEVYAQKFATFKKLFTYECWTDYTDWSDETASESDTRKVETRTVYQLKGAELDEHDYVNGTCTVCGGADPDYVEPVVVPELKLAYPSLNFQDIIYYNIYYTVSDMTDVVEMGLMTFSDALSDGTIDNALEVIPGYVENTSNYMSHTNGIPAKNMGDTLYFKAYAKLSDGTYAYSDVAGYSAKKFAMGILEGNYPQKTKSLMVAMLNYGAAAQIQFNHNTDNLMNAGLTDEQKAYVEAYSAGMVSGVPTVDSAKAGVFTKTATGYGTNYPSVEFGGAFAIHYYFPASYTPDGDVTLYYWRAADFAAAEVLTAENATGTVVMSETATAGTYRGSVTGIAAKEVDEIVYVAGVYESDGVRYCTGVIAYSLSAYCRAMSGSSAISANAKALAEQTAVYGYYAKQYFI